MSKVAMQYPLDLFGTNLSNAVSHPIKLGTGTVNRAFAFPTGPFFVDTLRMAPVNAPNQPLVRGTNYEVILLHPSLTKQAGGREIATAIVITKSSVPADITASAQIVGGPYAANVDNIIQCINTLNLDDPTINFAELRDVPDEFAGAPAFRDMGDFFGFEYIVTLLSKLNDAIRIGASAEMVQIQNMLKAYRQEMLSALEEHRTAEGNVHNLTRGQLDVYSTAEVRAQIQTVQSSINAVLQDIGTLGATDTNLTQQIAALVSSIGTWNTQLNTVDQNYQKTQLQIAELMDEILVLETQVGLLSQQLGTLNQGLAAANQEISNLKQQIANMANSNQGLENRIAALEQALANTNAALAAHQSAANPHDQYLNKNTGGVVQAAVHVNNSLTTRDDLQSAAGTR
ncbi:virion structural protein [Erwinia phage Derbicus]|uniref:Putative virion structural protein n=2 Tax=Derbicusvirus derbicus TaxID=2734104 RepID=A0A482IK89_9CAUD|nr:virion structural protein [Erwinia phage vB_EamM_EarlPhillipIV]YP_009821207.1 virion structural protein [Erwinia phage Derbicus]ANZ49012.1 putative virion structural protein [Erwinia phage vB_EamM_EarlPhillipIV]QBP07589.1 putative virion structural protein [Erwinia phage Derbicus]